jgi:hypothetical protein
MHTSQREDLDEYDKPAFQAIPEKETQVKHDEAIKIVERKIPTCANNFL